MDTLSESEIFALSQPAHGQTCGIYLLIYQTEIVYVGQSRDVYSRLPIHAMDKQFDRFTIIPCPLDLLNELEAEYIVKFAPRYNVMLPPNNTWATLNLLRNICKRYGYGAIRLRRYMIQHGITDTNGFYRVVDFAPIFEESENDA